MATRTRVEAFEAWLRATGTPEEIASFRPSIANGFVAVAGSKRVGLAHVMASVKLARDAGMDVTEMEKLGHLFVKFTDAGEPQIEDKPVEPEQPVEPVKAAEPEKAAEPVKAAEPAPAPKPFEMLPLPPLEPKPAVAAPIAAAPIAAAPIAAAPPDAEPAVISFRKSSQQPPLPKPEPPPEAAAAAAAVPAKPAAAAVPAKPAAAAVPAKPAAVPAQLAAATVPVQPATATAAAAVPAQPAAVPSQPAAAAAVPAKLAAAAAPAPASASPRRGSPSLLTGAALAAVVLGLVAWHMHSSSADANDGPDHLHRVAPLALDAEFPDGWHLATDPAARIGGLGSLKTALAARGGTDADPESRAFLAVLPLTDSLAAGADVTDDALVKVAQAAERGTSTRLTSQGGTYQTGGCSVAAIATHTAVCRGTVREGSRTLALETYVRVGEERAIVALFVAKLTVHDPAGEADRIVASFGI